MRTATKTTTSSRRPMKTYIAKRGKQRSFRPLLENLEPRMCLSTDVLLINFQLAGAPVPTRYAEDSGDVFGVRPNGRSYGWSSDHTDVARDREIVADQRLDTLVHFHAQQKWEIQLANGNYSVTVSIGDAQFDSTHTLNVEGISFWNSLPLLAGQFRSMTGQVTVSDGRLTLDQGAAIDKATRINYVQIIGLPAGPNQAPHLPNITEPQTGSVPLNPSDVHMEAIDFSDPDGDAHASSDWEIWTTGPAAERVWQTLGIGGVERLHTHLADGVFENSHAGRIGLMGNTGYQLRVRFRDSAGSSSPFATRDFSTGPESTIYPLSIDDISAFPRPSWVTPTGLEVRIPASLPVPSQLRLETSEGLLLSFTSQDGTTNLVVNPAELPSHAAMRAVITAGSAPWSSIASNLTFEDHTGIEYKVFLPEFSLAAGARMDLWIDTAGATYFGTPGQTLPDFSNLARAAERPVPFLPLAPDFVVESVAGGFQLPTNIAFVPNPGSAPDSPLFYVTELYGKIKVVSLDGTVSDYATGLLNFNPTGAFPGSGEQGLAGIVVDPATGDVYATRVTSLIPFDDSSPHHPQVLKFTSTDGGRTAATQTVILDMVGETQGQSHQISNITVGPDGKLYVHNGDGFTTATAQSLSSYRGKVLRMNLDGTAPTDNPFYNASNGIGPADYVFAYGLRNPFGGAWRAADGKHYEVENGPSVDRFAKIERGVNYGWNGTDASMAINAIYNWNPAHAPVNITFVQPETFQGSHFPASWMDTAFVSESGPTYATGPQTRGKRIVTFNLDASGQLLSGPQPFVEYVGTGQATVVGLAAGPDGLYFTELYRDEGASSPIDPGARVLRVRYAPRVDGDFNDDGLYDCSDVDSLVAQIASFQNDAAFDLTADGLVNDADLDAWLAEAAFYNLPSQNPYLRGDANLDGVVDGQDFIQWNTHKFTSGAGWCGGDYNADGVTDGQDFIVWNTNKFLSADAGKPTAPSIRVPQNTVPQAGARDAWHKTQGVDPPSQAPTNGNATHGLDVSPPGLSLTTPSGVSMRSTSNLPCSSASQRSLAERTLPCMGVTMAKSLGTDVSTLRTPATVNNRLRIF